MRDIQQRGPRAAQQDKAAPALLLTGATGATGQEIARQLAAAGRRARLLVRDPARAAVLAAAGFEVVMGDLAEPETLTAAVRGIDKLLLLLGDSPRLALLEGNLLQAARAAGVRQVVKISAQSAGLQPPVSFGRAHAQSERQLQRSGLAYTILRPHFYMQNLLTYFAPSIRAQGRIYAPLADARLNMVDLRDVASVAVRVLLEEGHAGQIYTISGPEALTFYQVARHLSAGLGRPVDYVPISLVELHHALQQSGSPAWFSAALVDLFEVLRAGVQAGATDVVERVGQVLPRRFRDFVGDYAAALRGDLVQRVA